MKRRLCLLDFFILEKLDNFSSLRLYRNPMSLFDIHANAGIREGSDPPFIHLVDFRRAKVNSRTKMKIIKSSCRRDYTVRKIIFKGC